MNEKYAKAQTIKDSFAFLLNLSFKVTREESLAYGSYVEFIGNGIKIYLGFDFKSYSFSSLIFLNDELEYSDREYGKEIFSFCLFAKKYDINCDSESLQPKIKDGYSVALNNNVNLLKKIIIKLL